MHTLDSYQHSIESIKAIPPCDKSEDDEALLLWNIDLVEVANRRSIAYAIISSELGRPY